MFLGGITQSNHRGRYVQMNLSILEAIKISLMTDTVYSSGIIRPLQSFPVE